MNTSVPRMRGARSAWPTPTEPCAQDEVWSVQRGSRATIWATRVGDGVGPFAWVPADLSYGDRQARRSSIWRASREGGQSAADDPKGKAKRPHSLPLLTYSAPGGLRQDPGRVAQSPAEARTCGNRELRSTCALVDVWVSAGRRTGGETRGAVAHSVRRCRCARRRTARSSWPRCNLVEWGDSCLT